MKLHFEIVDRVCVKDQAANALSRLNAEGTNDSYTEDDISLETVRTLAQSRQNRLVDTTPKKI